MGKVINTSAHSKPEKVPMVQEIPKMAVNPFDRLPDEMLEKILGNLDTDGMKNARLTCNHFKSCLEHCIRMSIPLTNETLKDIKKQDYRLKELKVILNQLQIPYKLSARMKQTFGTATKLHFMADEKAGAVKTIDGSGIQLLLKACQQIQVLEFDFHYMDYYRLTSVLDISRLQFPNLTTLQITFSVGSMRRGNIVEEALLRLKMPCLRNLEIERFRRNTTEKFQSPSNYIDFLECLASHKATLRSLKLTRILTTMNGGERFILENGYLEAMAELQLESLEIVHMADDNPNWVAANVLLSSQSELKVLKVQTNCFQLMDLIEDLLLRNADSLTTLELDVEPMAALNLDIMPVLSACTDLSLSFPQPMFGSFPSNLQHLQWNAPITSHWYLLATRNLIPNLRSLSLGPRALENFVLRPICFTLFGTPAERTGFTVLILMHKVVTGENNNDPVLALTEQLFPRIYKVEVKEDHIRITMP